MMHGAYEGDIDEETFARAYEVLAQTAGRARTQRGS